jgi:hypothetical protein
MLYHLYEIIELLQKLKLKLLRLQLRVKDFDLLGGRGD